MEISPEQQLRNLARTALESSNVTCQQADVDLIALHSRTLAEAVNKYLDGELPTVTDELSF